MVKHLLFLALFLSASGSAYAVIGDIDNDGIPDAYDNCINTSNPKQEDSDGDGIGNICDGDLNNDGRVDAADQLLFSKAFGSKVINTPLAIKADFNGDGMVDENDKALIDLVWAVYNSSIINDTIAMTNDNFVTNDGLVLKGDIDPNRFFDNKDVDKLRSYLGQRIIHSELMARKADTNRDGVVNFGDLSILNQIYGQNLDPARGDLNHDGRVNFVDMALFNQAYLSNNAATPLGKAIDYNGDGILNFIDQKIFGALFARANGRVAIGDLNNDGKIDSEDVNLLKTMFGKTVFYNNPEIVASDINGDDIVDEKDLAIIIQVASIYLRVMFLNSLNNTFTEQDVAAFNSVYRTGRLSAAADFNSDGIVNTADMAILRKFLYFPPGPATKLPTTGLAPWQIGLLINDSDPYSVAVGDYYRTVRGIPESNIVHLNVPKIVTLTPAQFAPIMEQVDSKLPGYVQAIAIAWVAPYRVKDTSITTAITIHYQPNVFFNELAIPPVPITVGAVYDVRLPFSVLGQRPSMLLAAGSIQAAKALIDRGKASERTYPTGKGFLMKTSDSIRNIRAAIYLKNPIEPYFNPATILGNAIHPSLDVQIKSANSLAYTYGILFYFQGLSKVNDLATNGYLPGAVGDNFTSFGGVLTESWNIQTTALEFINAGLTGSFGTVTEPSADMNKFPNPYTLMKQYTSGKTLIESYWSSVAYIYEGLFVGDPLACPWRR